MSVWTNFDPAIGPSRLLAAFEAVVLGGLGSLWGTLAGGIIIGSRRISARRFDAIVADPRQHLVFLVALVLRPQGLFPRSEPMPWRKTALQCGPRSPSRRRADPASRVPGCSTPIRCRLLTEFFVVLMLALMWNLLAGYADIISVGQQGFVGVGAYAFFGFTALAHLNVSLPFRSRG